MHCEISFNEDLLDFSGLLSQESMFNLNLWKVSAYSRSLKKFRQKVGSSFEFDLKTKTDHLYELDVFVNSELIENCGIGQYCIKESLKKNECCSRKVQ